MSNKGIDRATVTVSILGELMRLGVFAVVMLFACMFAAQIASADAERERIRICKPIVEEAIKLYASENGEEAAMALSKNPDIIEILSKEANGKGPWLIRTEKNEFCFQKDIWVIQKGNGYKFSISSPQSSGWFPRK